MKSLRFLAIETLAVKNVNYKDGDLDIYNDEILKIYKDNECNWFKVLNFACDKGLLYIVKLIIKNNGIDIKNSKYNRKALKDAARRGYNDTAKYLYKYHFEVLNGIYHKYIYINDAFFQAVENGHIEIVIYLIKKNIIIYDLNYAIVKACKNGHLNIIKFIVEFNDKIDLSDYIYDIITLAAENKYFDIIKYFIEKDYLKHFNECNRVFILAARNRCIDIVNYLIIKPINTFYINEAMKWACFDGYLDIVKLMIANGANVAYYDNSSLQWAIQSNHLDIVKFLIEETDCNDDYAKGLNWAAIKGHLEIVKYLIKKINYDNNDYDKCIYAAIKYEHLEIEKILKKCISI